MHTENDITTITMHRIVLILLAIFLSFGTVSGQTGHFIPSERFSSGLIADFCQDKYGSLWIATDYGLNRYDGYRFEMFLHSDDNPASICNNVAVSLLCDRDGQIWVGTNRGLDRFDEAIQGFVHYPFPENVRPRISDLLQLSDGSILVATAGYGAFIVDKEGNIKDPTILQSAYPSLDAEALRVVKLMPRWTPGRDKGQPVNVKFALPIVFKLN